MNRMGLLGAGVVTLLVGIALCVYGYSVEPTEGQAIGSIFTADFTDRRNVFMLLGWLLAAVGAAGVVGGALRRSTTLRA